MSACLVTGNRALDTNTPPPIAFMEGRVSLAGQGEDERLLARIADADRMAFEALYDRHRGAVYSLALSMLRDPALAQEIAQEVFLAVWRGAGGFDPNRGRARTWILSLAHHKCVDTIRRSRTTPASDALETMTAETDVVEEAMRRAAGAAVRRALGTLSAEQREALVLAYYGGYTQREIAGRLGIPLGTVKTRMRDGLLRLRSAMGPGQQETAT